MKLNHNGNRHSGKFAGKINNRITLELLESNIYSLLTRLIPLITLKETSLLPSRPCLNLKEYFYYATRRKRFNSSSQMKKQANGSDRILARRYQEVQSRTIFKI